MKRVLLTPLDWGLGHATRSIPVIRELQSQGCEVLIAGSGASLEVLRKEFPQLRFFNLPAYDPKYPATGAMVASMVRQLPHFSKTIRSEHEAVKRIIKDEQVDVLISDNRYGCWTQQVRCVFITHQSNILMPARFGFLGGFVRYISDRMINRFDECWIPDYPGGNSLAGDLAAVERSGVRTKHRYVGWLSRFQASPNVVPERYDVAAIFSGPEPQRTLFERCVTPQLEGLGLRYRIVRGLPMSSAHENANTVNFLTSEGMKDLLESSALILARSGYSTVMDLAALGRKAVFVPTPGQTEQEYLAARLKQQGIAFFMRQNEFEVRTAINESKRYSGFQPARKNSLLADAVADLLHQQSKVSSIHA
jgi:predicted glycosyltransferase